MTIDIERLTTAVGTEFVKALSDTLTSATAVKSVLKEMAEESSANFRKMGGEVNKSNEALGRSAKHIEAMGFSYKEIAKAIAGPAGMIGAFGSLVKVVNDFAVSSTRMINFARDTGIAEDTLSKFTRAGERLGYTSGEMKTFLGNLSAVMQDVKFHTDLTGTALYKAVEPMGEHARERIQIFSNMIKDPNVGPVAALQWFAKSIEKETPEIQNQYWAALGIPKSLGEQVVAEMAKVNAAFKPNPQIAKDWNDLYGRMKEDLEDWATRTVTRVQEVLLTIDKVKSRIEKAPTVEEKVKEGVAGAGEVLEKADPEFVAGMKGNIERAERHPVWKQGLKLRPGIWAGEEVPQGSMGQAFSDWWAKKKRDPISIQQILGISAAHAAEGGIGSEGHFDWGRMDMEGGDTARSRELLERYPKVGGFAFPHGGMRRGGLRRDIRGGHFDPGRFDMEGGDTARSRELLAKYPGDRVSSVFAIDDERAKQVITQGVESGVVKGMQTALGIGVGGGGVGMSDTGIGAALRGARGARFRRGGGAGSRGGGVGADVDIPQVGPTAAPGTYRPPYALGEEDTSDTVVNTIANEAAKTKVSIDAVINNMLNRVKRTQPGWGPRGNLYDVATAPKQYEAYTLGWDKSRPAGPKLAAFIRERMRLIASGSEPDITGGSNEFRASSYSGAWSQNHPGAPIIGGNRFNYDPSMGRGPYGPYSDTEVKRQLQSRINQSNDIEAERSRVNSGLGMFPPNWRMGGADLNVKFDNTPPGTKVGAKGRGVFDTLRLETSPQGATVGAGVDRYNVNAPD